VKRILTLAFAVVASLTVLSGCSYLRTKFGSKSDAYKNSAQTRPLEVPPDLDAPNHSGSLVIPEPGTPSASPVADAGVPVGTAAPSIAPPLGASTTLGGDGLQVSDSLANTWTRVGLALERSGIATIQSRDAEARTYDVTTAARTTKSAGWFKKAITLGMAGDKTVSAPVNLRVRVGGADGASKVTVEGATTASGGNAARDLLETLRQRMT